MADLSWQKKDRLNFTKIVDQINDATREVVKKELIDINNRINMLHRMGYIKDDKKIKELKKQIGKLGLNG